MGVGLPVTLPLAGVALVLALLFVPSHVNEATEPVDNLGGILSVVLVAALVLAINFAPVPNKGTLVLGLAAIALAALIAFFLRQRRAEEPALRPRASPRERIFWVAACAGIIVFGSLMGAMFVGQQFLQNVLGYSTLEAGAAILPAAALHGAGRAAVGEARRGPRRPLHAAVRLRLLPARLPHDARCSGRRASPYWKVGLGYALIGIGVGFAGTPASHSLTGSVPVERAGMASGTADLQRDLGGAIMQSIFGALLTAGYAAAAAAAIAASTEADVTDSVQSQLTKSFASAEDVAQQYPQYASQITAAAKTSFLDGDQWAYIAGIVAILLGAALVFFLFPKKDDEERLLAALSRSRTRHPSCRADVSGGFGASTLSLRCQRMKPQRSHENASA